jgi:signal transduction histidine kinase/CheY-like chemotaxis protein
MPALETIVTAKRQYNQWVANETLEDFALRYTASHARRWSDARVANTALGIVAFLALEAIGGAITLQVGFTNAVAAILVVCALIFLFGLPISYHAARSGLDIDLLTRGAGFGYLGSTISSLIYASFTFIFFALEAAIMSVALELLLGIPLAWAYVISALLVIPLVTHGMTRINRFQLLTQPIWLILQMLPLAYLLLFHNDILMDWMQFQGLGEQNQPGFELAGFGAAAAVIFPLMAQNCEQVDYLRFLRRPEPARISWWTALILAGPGWSLFGAVKLLIGSCLAVLALRMGIPADLASDPTHMYLILFGEMLPGATLALVVTTIFVVISQLKINVTNAYAGSLAWSNFFSRFTHNHPGRIVWLFFNVTIALLLMELGLYQAFETILAPYSSLVLGWIGALAADLAINRPLGLRPARIEFKRGHLHDINPVGVGSMLIAAGLGITAQLGLLGDTAKALAPFLALFTPCLTAPLIAWATKGRFYLARPEPPAGLSSAKGSAGTCLICANPFEAEDLCDCPAYASRVCSLCCALETNCADQCRPKAHLRAQTQGVLDHLLPAAWSARLRAPVSHFLLLFLGNAGLMAGLFVLVQQATLGASGTDSEAVRDALFKTYFLLLILTGVLLWFYTLANESRRKALAEARQRATLLSREVAAHEATSQALQAAKEAAVSANQAKSRYLSGVSHELRTPLNTILGYAQLLRQDSSLGADTRRAAAAIERGGEHLLGVIEGLLDISKIEARRLELRREMIDFRALIDDLVEVFRKQAQVRNLAFRHEVEPGLPACVMTDPKRLRQILTNLLSNAVKFTPDGEVSLRLRFRNQVARFIIADTGVGIHPDDQETIFRPFERVRAPGTQGVGGTGLGLTITRLLVNLLGGDLALESTPGKGSTFTLSLLLPVVPCPPPRAEAPARISGYLGPRRRILVVDDEPHHRALLRDALQPMGFTLTEAHDTALADELMGHNQFDLILLDVRLEGRPMTNSQTQDGWALLSRWRARGVRTPVIMISANPIENHRHQMIAQEHQAYLTKPIQLEALRATIGQVLNLTWHDQGSSPPESPRPAAFVTHAAIAPEDLRALLSMARIGYLSGVLSKLDALEQAGIDRHWLQARRAQAEGCDFPGLIRAIDDSLKEPRHDR